MIGLFTSVGFLFRFYNFPITFTTKSTRSLSTENLEISQKGFCKFFFFNDDHRYFLLHDTRRLTFLERIPRIAQRSMSNRIVLRVKILRKREIPKEWEAPNSFIIPFPFELVATSIHIDRYRRDSYLGNISHDNPTVGVKWRKKIHLLDTTLICSHQRFLVFGARVRRRNDKNV